MDNRRPAQSARDVVLSADPVLGPLAVLLAESGLAPKELRGAPGDALLVMVAGRELGMEPMQAVRMLGVQRGKVTLSADATVALVRRSSVCESWRLVESTREVATYATQRRGDAGETVMSWTAEMAQRAGLLGQSGPWTTYREAMLRARCMSALARAVYPDLVAGIYDPDELADVAPQTTRPSVAPAASQHAAGAVDAADTEVLEERPGYVPSENPGPVRSSLLAAILAVSDDAPEYVESLLARDGLDLGTAPLGRVQGALTYLGTQRGRAALAAYVAQRDAALDAPVEHDHDGE